MTHECPLFYNSGRTEERSLPRLLMRLFVAAGTCLPNRCPTMVIFVTIVYTTQIGGNMKNWKNVETNGNALYHDTLTPLTSWGWGKSRRTSVMIVGFRAKNSTRDFPNMKEECYGLPIWIQKISMFRDGQGAYGRVTPRGSTHEVPLSWRSFALFTHLQFLIPYSDSVYMNRTRKLLRRKMEKPI
jgi:hypothetical protein